MLLNDNPDACVRLNFTRRVIAAVLFIAGALCVGKKAGADWINLTGAETSPNIAEITVLDDAVKVALEIYVGDLEMFAELLPDDWLASPDPQRPPLEERMRRFSERGLQVATGDGTRLTGELRVAEPRLRVDRRSPFAGMLNPYTRQRVPDAPADKRVLYVEIIYPFSGRPASLTFIPPQDDAGLARATIGFITYHKSVPVIDFRYLGAPAKLNLDWTDPWYSVFENPNLKRHHKSAMMTFLYVEPWEVRHEILTRVKDLEQWLSFDLADDETIDGEELELVLQQVGEFLLARNPVTIDGAAGKPILDRINYVQVGVNGITLVENPQRIEVSTAIVGVILTYITDGIPQEVSVDWDLFTDEIQRVPAIATDPAGPLPSFVDPESNVHTWTNHLKKYRLPTIEPVAVGGSFGQIEVPLVSTGCAIASLVVLAIWFTMRRRGTSTWRPVAFSLALLAIGFVTLPYARLPLQRPAAVAGTIDPRQAAELLDTLLTNVYRAFDFREEEDVYDKLALTVDGALLTDLYLQHRRAFAVKKAGGAQAKVTAVEVTAAEPQRLTDGGTRASIRGQWNVSGTVGHWGHVHTRENRYEAVLDLVATDADWKIAAMDVLEEERVEAGAPGADATAPAGK